MDKSSRESFEFLVCGGCGCWCDDIPHETQQGTYLNACSSGQHWLDSKLRPSSCVPGQPGSKNPVQAELATANSKAAIQGFAERLASALKLAKRPLITGMSHSTLEAQRLAIAIADRFRTLLDPLQSPSQRGKTMAFQQSGEVSATWGEVKNRADLLVYWRCRPQQAPRFRERYGDLADGFLAKSETRKVFVIGSAQDLDSWREANSGGSPVVYLNAGPCDRTLLSLLGQALTTVPEACNRLSIQTDETIEAWQNFLNAMLAAKYAAVVVGHVLSESAVPQIASELGPDAETAFEPHRSHPAERRSVSPAVATEWAQALTYQKLFRWVAANNERRRCVVVPYPSGTDNALGAQSTLTWRTGFTSCVDFSTGTPCHDPVRYHWESLLKSGEVDFVLYLGGNGPDWNCPGEKSILDGPEKTQWLGHRLLAEWSQQHELWEIGCQPMFAPTSQFLAVADSWLTDSSHPQTICRPDGVMVPLRGTAAASVMTEVKETEVGVTEVEVLRELLKFADVPLDEA